MSEEEKKGSKLYRTEDGRLGIKLEPDFWEKMAERRRTPLPEEHHHSQLLRAIKERLPQLKELQAHCDRHWGAVDYFYRYYHQSSKAYRVQSLTENLVAVFNEIRDSIDWEPKNWPSLPHTHTRLNWQFLALVEKGTGIEFDLDHNEDWHKHTGPQFEAYFHAKMFLDLMIQCGENMDAPRPVLPSDWAAVLYLFRMR